LEELGVNYTTFRTIESDIETLQIDLDGLRKWAVGNAIKIMCTGLNVK